MNEDWEYGLYESGFSIDDLFKAYEQAGIQAGQVGIDVRQAAQRYAELEAGLIESPYAPDVRAPAGMPPSEAGISQYVGREKVRAALEFQQKVQWARFNPLYAKSPAKSLMLREELQQKILEVGVEHKWDEEMGGYIIKPLTKEDAEALRIYRGPEMPDPKTGLGGSVFNMLNEADTIASRSWEWPEAPEASEASETGGDALGWAQLSQQRELERQKLGAKMAELEGKLRGGQQNIAQASMPYIAPPGVGAMSYNDFMRAVNEQANRPVQSSPLVEDLMRSIR